jgi:hypothetical protein
MFIVFSYLFEYFTYFYCREYMYWFDFNNFLPSKQAGRQIKRRRRAARRVPRRPFACRGPPVAQGDTVILHCHWLSLTVVDCHSLGIHTVLLPVIASFSAKMIVPRPGHLVDPARLVEHLR